jgi:hypothetical protein
MMISLPSVSSSSHIVDSELGSVGLRYLGTSCVYLEFPLDDGYVLL